MKNTLEDKTHLAFLDFLRYLSAISVLLWHYQNFFLLKPDTPAPGYTISTQPFWNLLEIPYKTGFNAVPFFWILSGVVLTKSYLNNNANVKPFLINRFARLYPLHILTLILILIAQTVSIMLIGHPQVYKDNSEIKYLGNFLLLNDGSNFNGPFWSVSVEIFSYFAFTLLIRFKRFQLHISIGIVLISVFLSRITFQESSFLAINQLARCGIYFFSGCVLLLLAQRFATKFCVIFACTLTVVGLLIRTEGYYVLVLGIVLSFLLLEIVINVPSFMKKSFAFLGNLTYSTYLIHVPLQIVILEGIQIMGLEQSSIVANSYFFIFWFFLLHVTSWLLYKYFEVPMKLRIKNGYPVR
jgi:peptidoglycan/LPS O-acetylase OafA/YrhL